MMNVVCLHGRLTSDPQLRTTKDGVPVVNIRIANRITGVGGKDPCFFTAVGWRGVAEHICRYYRKGNLIGLDGYLINDYYEKDGIHYCSARIVIRNVHFMGQPLSPEVSGPDSTVGVTAADFAPVSPDAEDLPF